MCFGLNVENAGQRVKEALRLNGRGRNGIGGGGRRRVGVLDKQAIRVTLPSNLDAKGMLIDELEMAENPHEKAWTLNEWPVTHLMITEQNVIFGSDDGKNFRMIFGLKMDGEIFSPIRDAEDVETVLLYISGRMLEMQGKIGQETSGCGKPGEATSE